VGFGLVPLGCNLEIEDLRLEFEKVAVIVGVDARKRCA